MRYLLKFTIDVTTMTPDEAEAAFDADNELAGVGKITMRFSSVGSMGLRKYATVSEETK
jgi:hypothetical protein